MKSLSLALTFSALSISCLGPSRPFSSVVSPDDLEIAPLEEKEIAYQDWHLNTSKGNDTINLRSYLQGKKLVLVVYFAPWCSNWRHEMPLVTALYHKYKSRGFDVIGVSEYAPFDEVNTLLLEGEVPYPVVLESSSRDDRYNTAHYAYRKATGDKRGWGSPWHIFIESDNISPVGDTLINKAWVGNGELIESDVERFMQERLGS